MADSHSQKQGGVPHLLRPHILWTVIRVSGIMPTMLTFVGVFLLGCIVIDVVEPGINGLGDAAWFLYVVVITIGLGDYTCVTVVGRLVTVLISMYSVFVLALLTGTVVSYCNERLRAQRDESIAAFIDQLQRLPELSHEELVEISERVKRL